MSNIFTAAKCALLMIDSVITRAVLLFWKSTLQQQRRQWRQLEHVCGGSGEHAYFRD